MTGIRRALVLVGLTLAVIIGASIPASATFSDSVTVAPKVATATVSAPTYVSTQGTHCAYWQNVDGSWSGELRARISWPVAANTKSVTGYRVTAIVPNYGNIPVGDVPANQLSITGNFPTQYAYAGIRVTVTTLTAYGWTKESTQSAVVTC